MVVSIICLIIKGMMCDGRKFLDFDRDIAGCFIKHYHIYIYICMLFLYISMIIFPHYITRIYIYIYMGMCNGICNGIFAIQFLCSNNTRGIY